MTDEKSRGDICPESLANELLLQLVVAETRDDMDLVTELCHMVRAGQGAAGLSFDAHMLRGDDRILRCLADR